MSLLMLFQLEIIENILSEKPVKQAWAELYQAQFKLGLAMDGLSSLVDSPKLSQLYLAKHLECNCTLRLGYG